MQEENGHQDSEHVHIKWKEGRLVVNAQPQKSGTEKPWSASH